MKSILIFFVSMFVLLGCEFDPKGLKYDPTGEGRPVSAEYGGIVKVRMMSGDPCKNAMFELLWKDKYTGDLYLEKYFADTTGTIFANYVRNQLGTAPFPEREDHWVSVYMDSSRHPSPHQSTLLICDRIDSANQELPISWVIFHDSLASM